jgi:hypothetical protein
MDELSDGQMDALLAHELGHIATGDMARMIYARSFQASLVWWMLFSPLKALGRWMFLTLGEMMVLGLSRSREYYADAFGAAVAGKENMISLLEALEGVTARAARGPRRAGIVLPKHSHAAVLDASLHQGAHQGREGRAAHRRSEAQSKSLTRHGNIGSHHARRTKIELSFFPDRKIAYVGSPTFARIPQADCLRLDASCAKIAVPQHPGRSEMVCDRGGVLSFVLTIGTQLPTIRI